jgi:8-oxo-dGTP diphosphatase
METPTIIYKTALAVFKDKKMIMVRTTKNEEVFYTLGGKIEEGESGIECLNREVKEEAGVGIVEGSLTFLHEFEAPAYGRENTLVNIKLYEGKLAAEPTPSSEVVEIRYFDSRVDKKHLTDITLDMFSWLKTHSYID